MRQFDTDAECQMWIAENAFTAKWSHNQVAMSEFQPVEDIWLVAIFDVKSVSPFVKEFSHYL